MQTNIEMTEFNNSNNKKQIHCKLTYNDQIRRFIFNGTEFAELRGHVSNLLSLPVDGFVLKYVDNESDLITITSNEDLNLALELSDKILRLVIESSPFSPTIAGTVFPQTTPTTATALPEHFGRGGGRGRCRGRGKYQYSRHSGWSNNYPQYPPQENGPYFNEDKQEKAKLRIQSKINFLKSSLEQIPADDWKRQALQMKIHRLEGRMLRWDAVSEKKWSKHQRKEEKKEKKDKKMEHKKLSPEALSEVQILKAQIATLKPVLYQLKATKKAKKGELELALQNGVGDKETVWNEILRLKESIHETQKQISALKDQIHSITKSPSIQDKI
jgi:hypothetical protein